MTIIIKGTEGKSTAVNLSKHSWETEVVAGDESKIKMVLDDKRGFIVGKDKYNEIVSALEKTDGFLVLED